MMNTKSLLSRWVAAGLLTMICAGGCVTQQPGKYSYYKAPDGKFEYYPSDLSTGMPGVNPENYHIHWTLVTADRTRYDHDEYYITHSAEEPVKEEGGFPWHHPNASRRTQRAVGFGASNAGGAGTTLDYGDYTCITHPPDGVGWIEYGTRNVITHPPDTATNDRSK